MNSLRPTFWDRYEHDDGRGGRLRRVLGMVRLVYDLSCERETDASAQLRRMRTSPVESLRRAQSHHRSFRAIGVSARICSVRVLYQLHHAY